MIMKTAFALFAGRFTNYGENELFLKRFYPLGTYFFCSATNTHISLKTLLSSTSLWSGSFPDREKVYH